MFVTEMLINITIGVASYAALGHVPLDLQQFNFFQLPLELHKV